LTVGSPSKPTTDTGFSSPTVLIADWEGSTILDDLAYLALLAIVATVSGIAGRAVPTEFTSKMQIPPYVVWKPPTGEQHSPDALFDFICSPMRKQDGESDDVWEVRRNQYL
jgi:hypothetical protein